MTLRMLLSSFRVNRRRTAAARIALAAAFTVSGCRIGPDNERIDRLEAATRELSEKIDRTNELMDAMNRRLERLSPEYYGRKLGLVEPRKKR